VQTHGQLDDGTPASSVACPNDRCFPLRPAEGSRAAPV